MPFRTTPILRVGAEPDEWTLEAPLIYVSADCDAYVGPAGFVTDLASIPRLLYALVPVNGRHRAAAILHDWLYEVQTRTLAESDALFLAAMADSGVRWTQRYAMWAAVRVGGWVPWVRRAGAASEGAQIPSQDG